MRFKVGDMISHQEFWTPPRVNKTFFFDLYKIVDIRNRGQETQYDYIKYDWNKKKWVQPKGAHMQNDRGSAFVFEGSVFTKDFIKQDRLELLVQYGISE